MSHAMDDMLKEMLIRHEGWRPVAYLDTEGHWTVGVGHNLERPLSEAAILQILEDDVQEAYQDCLHLFPWFKELTINRQRVLVNMCFNLGIRRLLGFTKMLTALEVGAYETAAEEMLDSKWARQTGGRATELANLMRGSVET
jgi:lysozyme